MSKENKQTQEIENPDFERESIQMSLFEIIEPLSRRGEYSNTIEIYDSLPKYVWEQARELSDLSQAVITRKCWVRGNEYQIKIKPALIEKNNSTVLIYAGQREELVEDALRKLAVNGNGSLINGKAGVTFTLYELQCELKSTGHTYSLPEIKESLMVCRGATLECYSSNGDSFISSSFFPIIGLTTRGDYLAKGGDAKCYVQFNQLVNESIMNMSFRQYNYRIGMELRSPLARFIYKRMSHYWTQAAANMPYTPSLISFLTASPRDLSPRMPENIRAMKNALEALIKENIVSDYDAEQIKNGRKVEDVRYTIRPCESFVTQVKAANHRAKQTALNAIKLGLKNDNTK